MTRKKLVSKNYHKSIFNGKQASPSMTSFFETAVKLDYLPRAASTFIERLFDGIQPKPDCDIVESNLRYDKFFVYLQ